MKNLYKKIILLIMCMVSLTACTFVAKETTDFVIQDDQQFGEVLMNYFIKKDTTQLPAMVKFVSDNNSFSGTSKSPLYGFFAGVKHDSPKQFAKLKNLKISKDANKMLSTAEEYEEVANDMLNLPKYYIESPAGLDGFWGYYFATGDDRVIKKLCDTANNTKDPLVESAAKWSLNSNRKHYPDYIKPCAAYK